MRIMEFTATRFCTDLHSPPFHNPGLIVSQKNRKFHSRQISGSFSFGILSNNGVFNTVVTFSYEKQRLLPRVTLKVAPNAAFVASGVENDVESLLSEGANAQSKSMRSGNNSLSISSGARLENVRKSYKGVLLLRDVSWEVKKNEKVGLVGFNGAGKTTQLRILAGEEEADSGTVLKAKRNMKIVFMNQEFNLCNSSTVREELMKAFEEQLEIAVKLKKVEKAIEMSVNDLDLMGRLLDEFDLLHKRAQALDLDKVEFKIKKLIPEIGFSLEDSERTVGSFSSGWQMRISLGKILLQDPDLLLLDEPTNHLDLNTVEWLEAYLKKQSVPMVIVSHDRAFLDQLCTKIVDTDMGVSSTYSGNYSKYLILKAVRVNALYKTWKKQQKEVTHMKDLVHRLSTGPNSGRASSAEKKLEKLAAEDHVEKPFVRKQVRIRFPELGRSGTSVLKIKNLDFGYNNKVLFNKANLNVERGEKIAVIGPNGCGKSTILRIIMGLEKPEGGEVVFGNHNVHPNYFEQNQAEALDLEQTVLETVAESTDSWNLDDIKGLLGRCNFKVDSLSRKVSVLSGGEKARLAFCKFMVKPSTLLVLDEPTNHLDIPSKEMLEEAILGYKGTVVTVSHDRHFIKKIANRVVEINDSKLRNYSGGYSNYLEENLDVKAKESRRAAELEEKAPKVKSKSKMSKAEKEAQKKQRIDAYRKGRAKGKQVKMLKDEKNGSRFY